MRRRNGFVALVVGAGGLLAFPAMSLAHDINVFPGQSIQRAVIEAHHGDVIRVHRGTYHQVVEIKKDGLTLKGAGPQKPHRTLINPPRHSERCAGGTSGICISPHRRGGHSVATQDTQIKGFAIRGFRDFGAVAFNARHTIFRQDRFTNNGEYGVAAFGSRRTKFLHNLAMGSGEAGFYVGDSPQARAVLRGNRARDNGEFGFFLRDSSHGLVLRNTVAGNCLGIGLINTGSSGGVRGWRVRDNDAVRNNNFCRGSGGAPPISGTGIALLGAKKNQIHDNVVLSNRPAHPAPFGGGIVVVSSKPLGGTLAAQNVVKRNSALRNLPADIVWDGKGKGNRFRHNSCDKSQPKGLCG